MKKIPRRLLRGASFIVLRMENNAVLALDLGSSSIRILQYNRTEQVVDLVAINPIDPKDADNPTRLEDDIQNTLEGSGASATDVLACVSARNVVARRFRVPAGEKNTQEALEWEIGQQVLGSLGDFRIDVQEVGTTPDGDRDFLVVACRNDYVDRTVRLLRRIKLNPVLVDVDLFAFQNAFEVNHPTEVSASSVLVFTEPGRTGVALCRDGTLYHSTVLLGPSGGEDTAADAVWLSSQVMEFLNQPLCQEMAPISKLWLAGAVTQDDDLCKGLSAGISGISLSVLNPFQKIKIRNDLAAQIKGHAPLCSVAAGLLLRGLEG